MSKKPWFSFDWHNSTWKVFVADSDYFEHEDMEDSDAWCDSNTAEIIIHEKLSRGRKIQVLGHELFHTLCADLNEDAFRGMMGEGAIGEDCLRPSTLELEEKLAVFAGSGMMAILGAAGLLKFPKVPS